MFDGEYHFQSEKIRSICGFNIYSLSRFHPTDELGSGATLHLGNFFKAHPISMIAHYTLPTTTKLMYPLPLKSCYSNNRNTVCVIRFLKLLLMVVVCHWLSQGIEPQPALEGMLM